MVWANQLKKLWVAHLWSNTIGRSMVTSNKIEEISCVKIVCRFRLDYKFRFQRWSFPLHFYAFRCYLIQGKTTDRFVFVQIVREIVIRQIEVFSDHLVTFFNVSLGFNNGKELAFSLQLLRCVVFKIMYLLVYYIGRQINISLELLPSRLYHSCARHVEACATVAEQGKTSHYTNLKKKSFWNSISYKSLGSSRAVCGSLFFTRNIFFRYSKPKSPIQIGIYSVNVHRIPLSALSATENFWNF